MSDEKENEEAIEIGNWILERILGSGTFGKVMLFKRKETNERIAVKKCHAKTDTVNSENWRKEVEILHNLSHAGLVTALAIPGDLKVLGRDTPILCMEYCSGGDLRQMLNRPENCCGLPEIDVLAIAKNVAGAVQYLHSKQVVHRDLKPENIVIQLIDGKKSYKLIDLGYAKDLSQQSLCKTLVGTLQYLAPELFQSEKYTCTVDYWSLGLVIHECITGVRPFLPGLHPLQWMRQVEAKSRDDICIYRRPDETVVFSTTLFKENRLSSVMQVLMEQWLRLMLEWNPLLRGRKVYEDGDPNSCSPVIAFEQLDHILETQVLSLFWVDGLRYLSYIVDEEVTLEDLYDWIERDTGLHPKHQLILMPRGNSPDPERSARQLMVVGEDATTSVAYLFSKTNDTLDRHIGHSYPELMDAMLASPKTECPYYLQKRMWAQSTYYIGYQQRLHRKLVHGLKVHSTFLTLRASLLKQQVACLSAALLHVNSGHELSVHSLQLDQRNYQLQSQRGGLPSCAMLERWNDEEKVLSASLTDLRAKYESLERSYQSLFTSVHDAAKTVGTFLGKTSASDELDTSCRLAQDLYAALHKRPKEQREQTQNNIPMTKVVVRALKVRNESFTEVFTHIRLVEKYSAEIEAFFPSLLVLRNEIDMFQERLLQSQKQRQDDIWTLLQRAVTMWQRTSLMNESFSSAVTNSNVISLPALRMAERSSEESSLAIQENQTLRYQVQDSLSRGLSMTWNSLKNSMDWSFLDEED